MRVTMVRSQPSQEPKVKGEGYLGNGETQLGQLGLSDQRDGDAVGQHQVGADDVLNDVVT